MSRFLLPYQSVFDLNGHPLDGALLYFYETGTNTPKDTYSDSSLTTANTNPVVANSQGEFGDIFLNGTYRVELKDKNDVTQPNYPADGVPGETGSVVEDVAALKLIEGRENQSIFVLSYYAPDFALAVPYDEGGGQFAWDNTSTETDDGGVIIQATAVATGRWIRIFEGPINLKWYGATGDGTTDDTTSVQAAIDFAGSSYKVKAPAGEYSINTITATDATIIGDGLRAAQFTLRSDDDSIMFDIDNFIIENIVLDDNGRTTIDKTDIAFNTVILIDAVNIFISTDVDYITDRAVVSQAAAVRVGSKHIVKNCTVNRKTAPIASEDDTFNMFVSTGVAMVEFTGNYFSDLICRLVIAATHTQAVASTHDPVYAKVTNNEFDLIRLVNTANELKAIFIQGYSTDISNNVMNDVFGRCIDILSNEVAADTLDNRYRSKIENNTITYTPSRSANAYAANDEPGCIYVRYGDVVVSGNHLDFTSHTLTSNIYNSISVRHGYSSCVIENNTIINPIAYGINADISDSINTDESSVWINNNTILDAANSSRPPIYVTNASTSKTFKHIVIKNNLLDYASRQQGIRVLDSDQVRSFAFISMTIENNFNLAFSTYDNVEFFNFPEYLTGPKMSVTIDVDPGGTNNNGILTSITDALATISKYKVKELTIRIEAGVTSDINIAGSQTFIPLSDLTTIDANNGTARFVFQPIVSAQTGLAITLAGNKFILDDIRMEGVNNAANTTSLVFCDGYGNLFILDGQYQYGEYCIDTRGPNVSAIGGTIDNIQFGTPAVVICAVTTENMPKIVLENLTGATNTNLYKLDSPAIMMYENIALGTTAGTKAYTQV